MSDTRKKRMSMLDSLAAAGAGGTPGAMKTQNRALRSARDAVDGHRAWDLDPSQIEDDRTRDRLDPCDVYDLRDSIETTGQSVPILVRRHPSEDGRYLLVYGRRRLEAVRLSDKVDKVRALVANLDDSAATAVQITENMARRDLAEAIGPAHGVGRPRWETLARAVDETGIPREDLVTLANDTHVAIQVAAVRGEDTPDEPSVAAFGAVLAHLSTPAPKRPAQPRKSDAQRTLTLGGTPVDKWHLLRELGVARSRYGLSDRDLSVLQALLSFHPGTMLGGGAQLVVHPSNASICERAHGMPCSTMRRHLARLADAGLLIRRDSPNGKRYARRIAGAKIAFGFDLTPLLARRDEVETHASEIRATDARLRALRETVSLMRRDLAGLAGYGKTEQPDNRLWDRLSDTAALAARDLRRKLDEAALNALELSLREALNTAGDMLSTDLGQVQTTDPISTHAQNEQHHQISQKDTIESKTEVPAAIPFRLIQHTCTEIAVYSGEPVTGWDGLLAAAEKGRPMTGISASAWEDAKSVMGRVAASVAMSAMLERFSEIRSPGAYLRHLTRKARESMFSVLPMLLALANRPGVCGSQL